ncbi:glycosyltransferase family 25 protein [Pseudoalteromonas fenneropenaei]|uniref:Glycosyltransferase family 25 protein n=1 Tax=Pseudoalteromonas fenneropenaei TaxID=1737459 RepID=A0ABV7CC84_9GAMM
MICPIFVINMESSIERWATTQARLQEIGLEGQRFPATVGKLLTEQELEQWYDRARNAKHHHRPQTLGEIGCYISHYRIWQKVVDEQIPFCIVLEDDLTIEPHLNEVLEQLARLQHWDLIKLSDDRANPFIDTKTLSNKLTLGNYLKVPNGCQGYAVSLCGAKKLLARKPFFRPVDVDMQFHSELQLQLMGIQPYPVAEDRSFQSDISAINAGKHSHGSTFWKNLRYRAHMYFERKKKSASLEEVIRS